MESKQPQLLFGFHSFQAEMANFEELRKTDPEKCKQRFDIGMDLVQMCGRGELSKFKRTVLSMNKEDLIIYCKIVVVDPKIIIFNRLLHQVLSKC